MLLTNIPADNSTILFDVVPVGSYATIGKTYRVKHHGKYIQLIDIETGSSTDDPKSAYANQCLWEYAKCQNNLTQIEKIKKHGLIHKKAN